MMFDTLEAPKNFEAETALLGTMLMDTEAYHSLPADFTAEHFSEPVHQRIFTAIADEISKGNKADAIAMKPLFDRDPALSDIGGGAYLGKLVSSSFIANSAPELAMSLTELAMRREIIRQCQGAIHQAMDSPQMQAGEIIAALNANLEGNAKASRYRISSERDVSQRIVQRLSQQTVANCSLTGINRLDDAMGGGMYAGKLYGMVGRKKMGKTIMAGTISTNLQRAGTKHLYIALEMGSDEIQQRNLAREMGCYESAFRSGYAESEKFLGRLADYATTAKNYRLYLDAPGISFNDLRHCLPMLIRKYKLNGFILDCWQLVTGKQKGQSTAEHQDAVAQWLAETVKRFNVWGLVTAQENQDENTRGGEGIRLACDQLYRLCKKDETSMEAWLEMMDTRYTRWNNVGNEHQPALVLNEKGPYFQQMGAA